MRYVAVGRHNQVTVVRMMPESRCPTMASGLPRPSMGL